jgi:hypothetical protein
MKSHPISKKMLFIIFSKPNNPRGLNATILAHKAREHGLTGAVFNSITTAYQNALEAAKDADLIYIIKHLCGCRNFIIILFFAAYSKKEAYICTRNKEMKITN